VTQKSGVDKTILFVLEYFIVETKQNLIKFRTGGLH